MASNPRFAHSPYMQLQASQSSIPSSENLLNPALRSRGPTPNPGGSSSAAMSGTGRVSEKFALAPDPRSWGTDLWRAEADDELHNPDPRRDRKWDEGGTIFTLRGLANIGCLAVLLVGITTLFAGYPIISHYTKKTQSSNGGFNLGGTNATGQVPSFTGNWGMIDQSTPQSAYQTPSFVDGTMWDLVFSDEFTTEGRSFYPGDDPFWEAVDLWNWATGDMEWYDPAAITTKNGSLVITMSETVHLGAQQNYTSGMMTTWNKFCFTGGMVLASVSLPGQPDVSGLWPAIWSLGNLGRTGYGATLDGTWPYSYDSCDVGTVANQSSANAPADKANLEYADPYSDPPGKIIPLSFLSGQRLSRCTCSGQSHPGPKHSDGTYVGRSAPEIDMFEAQNKGSPVSGQVSQSGQWAPFNYAYLWDNTSTTYNIANPDVSIFNSYLGSDLQQATSVVTNTNQECYTQASGCFETYGFEYVPGFDNAYMAWIANGARAWTLDVAGMGADDRVEISARPMPQEPMYLIVNLAMAEGFGYVDLANLIFPVTMQIDWIRVYQDPKAKNVGCDPPDFPTAAYINQYIEAYTNPNLTTWVEGFGQEWPTNSFLGEC